tara:strand:- start:209 stop:673 length:465 start_codon:yes stop_codon:yes gene_type:complete
MSEIQKKLKNLGIDLPEPPAPVASYRPWILSKGLLFISGQIPIEGGKLCCEGKVTEDVSVEEAINCAKLCFINLLAVSKDALTNLDNINRIVRLEVFVASPSSFHGHPIIANGASDLAVEIFEDKGTHARIAVGAPSLPLNAPVEIAGILEVDY